MMVCYLTLEYFILQRKYCSGTEISIITSSLPHRVLLSMSLFPTLTVLTMTNTWHFVFVIFCFFQLIFCSEEFWLFEKHHFQKHLLLIDYFPCLYSLALCYTNLQSGKPTKHIFYRGDHTDVVRLLNYYQQQLLALHLL